VSDLDDVNRFLDESGGGRRCCTTCGSLFNVTIEQDWDEKEFEKHVVIEIRRTTVAEIRRVVNAPDPGFVRVHRPTAS